MNQAVLYMFCIRTWKSFKGKFDLTGANLITKLSAFARIILVFVFWPEKKQFDKYWGGGGGAVVSPPPPPRLVRLWSGLETKMLVHNLGFVTIKAIKIFPNKKIR